MIFITWSQTQVVIVLFSKRIKIILLTSLKIPKRCSKHIKIFSETLSSRKFLYVDSYMFVMKFNALSFWTKQLCQNCKKCCHLIRKRNKILQFLCWRILSLLQKVYNLWNNNWNSIKNPKKTMKSVSLGAEELMWDT